MITTIFFDIGKVLANFDHTLIWKRLAQISKLSEYDIAARIQSLDILSLHETGHLSSQGLFNQIRTQFELTADLSFDDFARLWSDIFQAQWPVIHLAEQLHQRYSVMLLSNTGEIHWNWLVQTIPFFTQVDDAVLSFRVGYMKPAPEIYHAAIQCSHSAPEQCAYIDDVAAYAETACQLGIHGIHFRSFPQLQDELRALHVAW